MVSGKMHTDQNRRIKNGRISANRMIRNLISSACHQGKTAGIHRMQNIRALDKQRICKINVPILSWSLRCITNSHQRMQHWRCLQLYYTISHRQPGGRAHGAQLFQPFCRGVPGDADYGLHAVLVQGIAAGGDLMGAIWTCAGYTVLLCFVLFKTGSLSKSIWGAH